MDTRDTSLDETDFLNPNAEQQSPKITSIPNLSPSIFRTPQNPRLDEGPVTGFKQQIGTRLTSVLRVLTINLTLANMVIQFVSIPLGPLQKFLVVWDFFILTWFPLVLLFEVKSRLPPISIFIGDWWFRYPGPNRGNDYGGAVHGIAPKRSLAPMLLSILIDTILTFVLCGCSISSVALMSHGWRWWYHDYQNTEHGLAIGILHLFSFALMLATLVLSLIQAQYGTSVSLKLTLARGGETYKYTSLPRHDAGQRDKRSVCVHV